MAKRLTKNTYKYLEQLAKDSGTTLYQITKRAGVNHQVLTQWKTSDPKTCEILDAILREIAKVEFRKPEGAFFQHNEEMLSRFEPGTVEHGIILDRLTRE